MLTADEAQTRVTRGAAYLDAKWPDWYKHIDVRTLNMGHPCECILGQISGDYNEVIDKLWPDNSAPFARRFCAAVGLRSSIDGPYTAMQSEMHGFDAPDSDFHGERAADFDRLKDHWVSAIAERLYPVPAFTGRTTTTGTNCIVERERVV